METNNGLTARTATGPRLGVEEVLDWSAKPQI